jgi:hypothetical protein
MRRLLISISAMLILGLIYLIGWSSLLTISSVTVETTDPKNISLIESELASSGLTLEVGEPLARINTRAIERSLKDQPWIGEVNLERDWIGGEVRLFVRERIPRFLVEGTLPVNGGSMGSIESGERFMTDDGTLFELPGDLAAEYQELPRVEIRSETSRDRGSAAELFAAIEEKFPTQRVIVTSISTFITESRVPLATNSDPEGQSASGRSVRISWGELKEIPAKVLVVEELMKLKANREVSTIDVSNPRLPIVSR